MKTKYSIKFHYFYYVARSLEYCRYNSTRHIMKREHKNNQTVKQHAMSVRPIELQYQSYQSQMVGSKRWKRWKLENFVFYQIENKERKISRVQRGVILPHDGNSELFTLFTFLLINIAFRKVKKFQAEQMKKNTVTDTKLDCSCHCWICAGGKEGV